MEFLICIAGLPQLIANELRKQSPARLTTAKNNPPIIREIREPYSYRTGMSDFFLANLAGRLERIAPTEDVGIGLVYSDYSGAKENFLKAFYPFAAVAPLEPIYPSAWEKRRRRSELANAVESLVERVDRLRERILLIRDVLSGQNFSPLTLPLRNFRSDVLQQSIARVYDHLGTQNDGRNLVEQSIAAVYARHPLNRLADSGHQPFFEDNRGLRFKSPGRYRHAMARTVSESHALSCLINGRTRLGGPLKAGFHYDCAYERNALNPSYPNCHGVDISPGRVTHVNISPNDAIR